MSAVPFPPSRGKKENVLVYFRWKVETMNTLMLQHKFKNFDLSIWRFLAFGAAKVKRLHAFLRRVARARFTLHIFSCLLHIHLVPLVLSRFGVVDQHHHAKSQILQGQLSCSSSCRCTCLDELRVRCE